MGPLCWFWIIQRTLLFREPWQRTRSGCRKADDPGRPERRTAHAKIDFKSTAYLAWETVCYGRLVIIWLGFIAPGKGLQEGGQAGARRRGHGCGAQ
ncbi:hypothetical protein KFL_002480190 [Klebsormidium nitens]|uniref:Uncharacterized protein n=1 Tax=Klebsormidium nitens TaxID=105231 RepID=A0A1Y1I975_KLENI|nr:hypothetical protein KFL_002480190 [Klebsormidium nitens]|eukprot:GAQ85681.1 hypothetical protein KFL_002480190 [Klebsormidium nitens]